MTGNVPYDGDLPRSRLPAAQVFRRTTQPRSAPWERRAQPELRSYPAPPPLDGQPAADDTITQLIPRFRDEDYPYPSSSTAPSGTVPPTKIPPGGTDPTPQPEPKPQKSLLAASGSIAVATLVSRITGFAKQVAMTATLGPAIASAFTVSTILPNMISELVLGAVVLLKVMEPDGEITMRTAWSPGLSWMERVGMEHAAAQADQPAREERRDAVLPPARLDLVEDLVDEDEPA